MAKFKINDSVWSVLGNGLKFYFLNIGKFTKYMLFPVFGQVFGIALVFGLTGWLTFNLPVWVDKYPIFSNFSVIVTAIILAVLPGFALFLKAFWDFLVAYGAINSMTEALITTNKLYDLKAHTETVTSQSLKFVGLICAISILTLIALNPLFWILGLIFFVYFVLVFQVFTFEKDATIIGCFKRSFDLIKGNFARTFVIMVILGLISHYILNFCVSSVFEIARINEFLRGIFESWALTLPLAEINGTLMTYKVPEITPLYVANEILSSSLMFIIGGLTLPMRSVCWTLWYKNLCQVKEIPSIKKSKKDRNVQV